MSDFEPITIEIEASASRANTELDRVDQALGRIQSSIGEISQMLNGISGKGSSLSSSMRTLANAINGINPNNIKEVSKSVDSMASSSERAEKKVKTISSSVNELNSNLSKTNQASTSFEEMLPALAQANDYMSAFNSWAERCFRKDLGIGLFGQQLREIPQIMQEITASNGAEVITRGFQQTIPLIEQATDGMINFDRYVKDCFNADLGNNNIAREFVDIEQKVGTALVPFRNFTEELGRTETEITDFVMIIQQSFGNVPAVIYQASDAFNRMKNEARQSSVDIKEAFEDAFEGMKRGFIALEDFSERGFRDFKGKIKEDYVELGEERIMPEQSAPIDIPSWKDALNQVKSFYDQYNNLTSVMGEANAEMQVATNIVNTLNRAFSMTKTGQMSWDTSRMKEASAILSEMQDKIDRVNASFKNQNMLEGNATPELETWKTVFEDIEAINNSFNGLSQKIGEANAEMSNLVDVRNRLNKAFSDTESGKLPWDNESMQRAYKMLDEVNDKINRVKTNLKDPDKLEINVDPTGELEKLYARLKEVQSLISDMRNNKINFSTEDMTSALKEQESITKRIAELEGRGKSKETGTLPWMAQVIALQHELEKMSGMFDRWGEVAKKAFLKALTPLKLFKHEFEEIKGLITSVSRIGSAFAMISKPITKVFKNFQKSAQQAFSKIQKAWAKVMRTFTFMLIRKAITAILTNINNAITSLAKFSKTVDGKFNDTMSLLTSDFRYLGASLVAAFAPILNYVMPIIDRLVDSLVGVINKVNLFFAVLTKSKTYTIAKKKIVDYTDAMEDANKKAKQLTLGIDELNILSEDTATKKDEEDMFDWVTLPTPEIDIPDWLKWLKGLWDKLWQAIKKMLKALWDAIKDAWNRVKDYFINAIKHFLESLVGLITDIIRDLTRLFNTEKFKEFLAKLMRIVAKIIEFIAIIIDKIREAWNYNELGYKILEAILDILDTIATHVENILDLMIAWAHSLTFVPLFEAILKVLQQINYAIDQIGYVAEDVAKIVLGILKLVIEDYAPRLLRVIGDIIEGIGNIAKQLHEAIEETDFVDSFVSAFDGIMQAIIPHLEEIGAYFAVWASQLDFKPLLKAVIKLMESLKPVADFIGGVFADLVEHYILPMSKHIIEKIIPQITEAIAHFADAVDWSKLRKNIDKLIRSFEHLTAVIGEGVAKAMDYLGQALAKFINSDRFTAFVDYIEKFAHEIDGNMIAKVLEAIGLAIIKLADAVMKFVMSDNVQNFLNGLIKFVKTTSVDKLADILTGIAKAFVLFKGLSFLTKTASHLGTFLVPIGKIIATFGTGGALAVALAAGAAAFILFHKQISAIDWKAVIGGIESTILNGINAIDWKGVGEALAHVLGATIPMALKSPAFVLALTFGFMEALIEAIQGIGDAVFQAIQDKLHEMGAYAIEGFFAGVHEAWDAFWGFWADLFQKLVDVVKLILGINSPSTVFAEIGRFTIEGLWQGIVEKWEEFWGWISGIWGEFVNWAKGIWQSVVDGALLAWTGFTEKIALIWETIKTWFSEAFEGFRVWCSEKWQEIVNTIVGWWNTLTEGIQTIWTNFNLWITEKFNEFKTWASGLWGELRDFIVGCVDKVKQFTIDAWEKIHTKIKEVWGWLKGNVGTVFNTVKNTIINAWTIVHNKTSEIWSAVQGFLASTWEDVKNNAEEKFSAMRDFLLDVFNSIQSKWEHVWTGVKNAVVDLWGGIKSEGETIIGALKNYLDIVWDGMRGLWYSAWTNISNAVKSVWSDLSTTAESKFNEIKSKIAAKWEEIKAEAGNKWEAIKTSLSTKWSNLKSEAKRVFSELAKGISDEWQNIKNAVSDTWQGVKDFLGGIGDSFTDLTKTIGKAIDKLKELGKEKDNVINEKTGKPFWQVDGFADGGFPDKGSLFVAGESGAELVGTINGKTAVANQQEITKAIQDAVSEAMVDVSEKFETAIDKLTINLEEVVGEMLDEALSYVDKLLSRVNLLIVEVVDTRATVKDTAQAEMEVLKALVSKLMAVFDAVRYDIVESNRSLEDSYRNDDSAVTSSFSRMSQSYEFANDGMIEAMQKLVDIIRHDDQTILDFIREFNNNVTNELNKVASVISSMSSSINGAVSSGNIGSRGTDADAGNISFDNLADAINHNTELIGEGVEALLKAIKIVVEDIENFNSMVSLDFRMIYASIESFKNSVNRSVEVPQYATGGMPEDGWFRASHGEIMGRFDNGQSVVANNEQITDGIARAVSSSLVPILNDIAQSSRETANKDLSLSVDSREIARASNTGQTRLGKSLITFT